MSSGGARRKVAKCRVHGDPGDPALPVAGTGTLSRVRRSRNAKRRAAVLIGLHLLVAVHVTHYLLAGRTLSPVEPSESMYTLELGYVNAGFIFFVVALLATLAFGRFVCGWGCHLVALQDLCGWVMKRLGVRPRPFRSRLLVFAPAAVAFYMFAWPTVRRLWIDRNAVPFPGFSNHLVTSSFWDTFPGPLFAVLTFVVCGFAAVYFLGAKGFCTYGCPYGALFGGIDRFSPAGIVVTDACEQCGHCTATCTSNVRVHEEVRLYGRVVDPGCMKCMDCVSVCPMNALHFGYARPSWFKHSPAGPARPRRYDLNRVQEVVLAAIAIVAFLAYRGLYDGPPLLLSVCLGGLTAYAALVLWKLVRDPAVQIQSLRLKLGGRLNHAGWAFTVLAAGWLTFAAHSAAVQWERHRGSVHLSRLEATRAEVLDGSFRSRDYSDRHAEALRLAWRHLSRADAWGLVGVVEIKLGLAWIHMLREENTRAESTIREAIALAPGQAVQYRNLSEFLLAQGRIAEAIEAMETMIRFGEPSAADHFELGGLYALTQRYPDAARELERCVALAPESAEGHYNLGGVLRRLGRSGEAIVPLGRARDLAPHDAATHVELGLAYLESGDSATAVETLRRAVELDPDSPESRLHLTDLIRRLESELGQDQ